MMPLSARTVDLIGFVAAFLTTAGVCTAAGASAEAALCSGDFAEDVSDVLAGSVFVAGVWDLYGIEAGDCVKHGDAGVVA